MFRYLTSYRFYTLSKVGFGIAYLWYVLDFFRIHVAGENQLTALLSDPSDITFSGNRDLDVFLRQLAIFISWKAVVWIFFLVSPLIVGLFLWGRHRWLQFAVGCWMSFSMVSLASLVGFFVSTADIWVNYVFVVYGLTALISSDADWEKCESGFSMEMWRKNPVLESIYAWFVVLVQFTVYFYAGVNKLVDGWDPWTSGVALQNLAFDSSMHDFARGIHVPYWISLVLCYVTLLQRLVVPFGFYIARYRIWSVLILGTMHIGYAILMNVNLFPLIGISSLLMILPPRTLSVPVSSSRVLRREKKQAPAGRRGTTWVQGSAICFFSVWIGLESTRLTVFRPFPWENKLMLTPAWRMFADGGAWAGGKWRLILKTPQGEIDVTDIALEPLPHIWRDRFYVDAIFHGIIGNDTGPSSLVAKLIESAEKKYGERQIALNRNPAVLGVDFSIIHRDPNAISVSDPGLPVRTSGR
jgi:hypothetical protein